MPIRKSRRYGDLDNKVVNIFRVVTGCGLPVVDPVKRLSRRYPPTVLCMTRTSPNREEQLTHAVICCNHSDERQCAA
eukprot:2715735-Amphidinium_carterae.1